MGKAGPAHEHRGTCVPNHIPIKDFKDWFDTNNMMEIPTSELAEDSRPDKKLLLLSVLRDKEKAAPLELETVLKQEEMFWAEKTNMEWFRDGDHITEYFHIIAKVKRSRNTISLLMNGDQVRRQICPMLTRSNGGFIQGINIRDCICLASEAINVLDNNRKGGNIAMKVDISNAFVTISWDLILKVLCSFGFCITFCNWIRAILSSAFLSIIFNAVSKEEIDLIKASRHNLVPSHVIYVDDIMLFCTGKLSNIKILDQTFLGAKRFGMLISPQQIHYRLENESPEDSYRRFSYGYRCSDSLPLFSLWRGDRNLSSPHLQLQVLGAVLEVAND
ncbi:unnamed protein product [Vicia faba]|uniref:Reverse transcriptase domain-containing protein n=1 Tax=Vicia faba TaxID=3906 RepID=A0AAV0ZJJ4_VICFA|nr:unnamed protein product [Vicia faba]